MRIFLSFLLLERVSAQLTVGGWFFPVSVPPPDPADNTVYDEEVAPEVEVNVTRQEIKDYYEKDKMEKWSQQRPILQPVFKKQLIDEAVHRPPPLQITAFPRPPSSTSISTTPPPFLQTLDPLEISRSRKFFPGSGLQKFIPTPLGIGMDVNEEPVITMSMSPIKTLDKPDEITVNGVNKSPPVEMEREEISSSTRQVTTTKVPFIYEIPKTKHFDEPQLSMIDKEREKEKEKDLMKLKRDVFRLRNEMNLVKALMNKLYKRSYRKQRDYYEKKTDSTTRLSAFQADGNNEWTPIRAQRKNRHLNKNA